LSIGHVSPEAASGGAIALVQDGDSIEIDIPNRTINLAIPDAELAKRRASMEAKRKAGMETRNGAAAQGVGCLACLRRDGDFSRQGGGARRVAG